MEAATDGPMRACHRSAEHVKMHKKEKQGEKLRRTNV